MEEGWRTVVEGVPRNPFISPESKTEGKSSWCKISSLVARWVGTLMFRDGFLVTEDECWVVADGGNVLT